MDQDVKEYLASLFMETTPLQFANIQNALKKRPSASVREISELQNSNRSLGRTTDVVFTEEVAAGGIGVRAIYFPKKGDSFPAHSHTYDHLTYLAMGSVLAYDSLSGKSTLFEAPAMILSKAHREHQFVANEDNTHMMCLHKVEELDERGHPYTVVEPHNLIGEENGA